MDNSVQRVIQRINEIEQRFCAISTPASTTFAATLDNAQANQGVTDTPVTGSGDIEKIIRAAAQKYSVDPKLALAIAKTESNLQPQAVSSAGAVGVMQLMPDTAKSLGVSNPNDPQENIDGGVRYLQQLLTTFKGDVTKAVAAYNAGPAAVKQYKGIPPYAETRNYVNKVMTLTS